MNSAPLLEAPVTLLPLPRPLMTAEVLDAAFRLFRAGLLRTLPYSGIAVLVLEWPAIYAEFFGSSGFTIAHAPVITDTALVFVSALLLSVLLFGMITLRLNAVSRGERPRFRHEIGTALKRWPTATIATLAAFGFPLLMYGAARVINPFFALQLLGVLMLPVLWPMALFVAALPAFWCDGLGPFAAIARAVRVSRRRTWRIVGAILATGCVVGVFYVLTAIFTAVLGSLMAGADLFLMSMVRSMLALVVGALGVPFVVAMLVVIYEDLKLRDVERRAVRA